MYPFARHVARERKNINWSLAGFDTRASKGTRIILEIKESWGEEINLQIDIDIQTGNHSSSAGTMSLPSRSRRKHLARTPQ